MTAGNHRVVRVPARPLLRFAEDWPATSTDVDVAPTGEDRWVILVYGDTLAICGDKKLARETAARVRETLRQETSAHSQTTSSAGKRKSRGIAPWRATR